MARDVASIYKLKIIFIHTHISNLIYVLDKSLNCFLPWATQIETLIDNI